MAKIDTLASLNTSDKGLACVAVGDREDRRDSQRPPSLAQRARLPNAAPLQGRRVHPAHVSA
eukprot:2144091-Rhodomonas_salina.2